MDAIKKDDHNTYVRYQKERRVVGKCMHDVQYTLYDCFQAVASIARFHLHGKSS